MNQQIAYIGLGANLGNPAAQLRSALAALAAQPGLLLHAQSTLYRSAPLGEGEQADYCNAVCAVMATLSPQALMDLLLRIEREHGRVRDGRRWQSRVLDLDLLHIPGCTLDTPSLTLPHPELARRNFVLVPLCEIAPDLHIPGFGAVAALAQAAGHAGLRRWAD